MSKGFEPTFVPIVAVEKVLSDFEKTELGQWYWVKSDDPGKQARLMCVMEIGSNYAPRIPKRLLLGAYSSRRIR